MDIATGIALALNGIGVATAIWVGIGNRNKLTDIHVSIDGRMDELLATTTAKSIIVGAEQARAADKDATAAAAAKVLDAAADRAARALPPTG